MSRITPAPNGNLIDPKYFLLRQSVAEWNLRELRIKTENTADICDIAREVFELDRKVCFRLTCWTAGCHCLAFVTSFCAVLQINSLSHFNKRFLKTQSKSPFMTYGKCHLYFMHAVNHVPCILSRGHISTDFFAYNGDAIFIANCRVACSHLRSDATAKKIADWKIARNLTCIT